MSDLLRRHGPKLAVGGLVVLNLVLLGALALRDPMSTAIPAAPVSASSSLTAGSAMTSNSSEATPGPSASPSGTPVPSTSPPPSKEPPRRVAGAPSRLLAANSGRVAWRATSTDCRGKALVEVTTNGGRSWSKTNPGLTAIVRLKAYGDGSVFAIGADRDCRPTYAWIAGPKQEWQRNQARADNAWYRPPDDLNEVHAPGGRTSEPCGNDLVDLAGIGTFQAAVLCADGRIRTRAENRSWQTVHRRSRIVSLNADDDGFVAVTSRRNCSGVVVKRFDSSGNGLSHQGRCQSAIGAPADITVVAARYNRVWLWFGDKIFIS